MKSPVGSLIYAPVMYNSLSPDAGVEQLLGFNVIPELVTPGSGLYVDPAIMSQYFGPGKQVREPRGSAPYNIGGKCSVSLSCRIGDNCAHTHSVPLRLLLFVDLAIMVQDTPFQLLDLAGPSIHNNTDLLRV